MTDMIDEDKKLEISESKHTLSELVNIYRRLKEKVLNKPIKHDRDNTILGR